MRRVSSWTSWRWGARGPVVQGTNEGGSPEAGAGRKICGESEMLFGKRSVRIRKRDAVQGQNPVFRVSCLAFLVALSTPGRQSIAYGNAT